MTFINSNAKFIKNMLLEMWFKEDNALPILIEQTLKVFDDWIQTEILSSLSDSKIEEFDKFIIKNPSDQEIYSFFNNSINNFDAFVDGLYDKFKKTYKLEYKKLLYK